MTQTKVEAGSLAKLPEMLESYSGSRILLVTGGRSYDQSGAALFIPALLAHYEVTRFHKFSTNPQLQDLQAGITVANRVQPDVIVAIGGGSVLDMAKMVRSFSGNECAPQEFLRDGHGLDEPGVPLIVAPTTAGSGSEATQFAVLYVDGKKHSVDHPQLLPNASILDPDLTISMPRQLAASTGIDALAQAIESHWSVSSTPESHVLSRRAMELAWANLREAVNRPTEATRAAMMEAAHVAGKAINITRTTAPHALSYALTIRHGVSHGHAVGLSLGEFLLFNSNVRPDGCLDARGPQHVRRNVNEIVSLLGGTSSAQGRDRWYHLLEEIGLTSNLLTLGISNDAVRSMASEVDTKRLANNPRLVSKKDAENILFSRMQGNYVN